jgi:hypothetical protein
MTDEWIGQSEGPLIRGLKELNESLTSYSGTTFATSLPLPTLPYSMLMIDDQIQWSSDLGFVDARSYLQPFLAVVVSDTTDAHITGLALLVIIHSIHLRSLLTN